MSTAATPWHAPDDLLQRFARTPEALDDVAAASLEEHLITCAACRAGVAAHADPAVAAASWEEIADTIDRPRAWLPERVLGRVAPRHVVTVVAATPALRLSWAAAVAAVIGAAVAAAHSTGSDGLFLALAPFITLAAVTACYLPGAEPAGEAAAATPMFGAGLMLLRTLVVVVVSVLALGAGALALPGLHASDAAWLLPSLAVAGCALALCTWLPAPFAAGLTGLVWLTAIQIGLVAQRHTALPSSYLFTPAAQVSFAVLAVAAAAVVAVRRTDLERLELP